jgi:hypothetical protein
VDIPLILANLLPQRPGDFPNKGPLARFGKFSHRVKDGLRINEGNIFFHFLWFHTRIIPCSLRVFQAIGTVSLRRRRFHSHSWKQGGARHCAKIGCAAMFFRDDMNGERMIHVD